MLVDVPSDSQDLSILQGIGRGSTMCVEQEMVLLRSAFPLPPSGDAWVPHLRIVVCLSACGPGAHGTAT